VGHKTNQAQKPSEDGKTADHFDELLGILHGFLVLDVTRGKPRLDVVSQPLHTQLVSKV